MQVDIGYKVGGYCSIPSIVIPSSKLKSITVHFKSKSIVYTNKAAKCVKTSKQANSVRTPSAIVISLPSRGLQCNVTEILTRKSVNRCLLGATSCSTGKNALNVVDLAVEVLIGFGSVESIPTCVDQYYAVHYVQ